MTALIYKIILAKTFRYFLLKELSWIKGKAVFQNTQAQKMISIIKIVEDIATNLRCASTTAISFNEYNNNQI